MFAFIDTGRNLRVLETAGVKGATPLSSGVQL